MSGGNGVLWKRLVTEALSDPDRVSEIFAELDPILRKLARKAASRLTDDALQAGYIAIWKALPKVDLDRSHSIRSMLLKTAYHAMRDEMRRELRQSRLPFEHLRSIRPYRFDERRDQFGGILDRYAEYVRQTGSFSGSHRHIAKTLGVSIAKTTSDFHRAAREYVEREDLRPRKKQYADIIEMILQATKQTEPVPAGQ